MVHRPVPLAMVKNSITWISMVVEAMAPPDKVDAFFRAVDQLKDDGCDDYEQLIWMTGALYDGLKKGNWAGA